MRQSGVAAALFLMIGSPLPAQSFDFSNFCTTTSLVSCGNLRGSVTDLGGGSVQVHMEVQNLQGTNPAATAGTTAFGVFFFEGLSSISGLTVGTIGSVQQIGGVPNGFTAVTASYPWGVYPVGSMGSPLSFIAHNSYSAGTLVVGCSASPAAYTYLRTCAADGYDGWVTFDFTATQAAPIRFGWETSFYPYGSAWRLCVVGDESTCTGTVRDVDPGIVPEPQTYALLATGMVLVLGAARRRRALSGT
jgi:hypothetical protein